MTAAAALSKDELAEIKEYSRWRLACTLSDIFLDLLFYSAFVLFLAKPLDDWLFDSMNIVSPWTRLAAFYVILYALNFVVSFPLAWISGHRLEQKFDLSRQTFPRWLSRHLLKVALISAFVIALSEGLYLLIWVTGDYWWCWAAAGMFVVSALLGQLAPVLILPLFYKVELLDDSALLKRFKGLAKDTDLRIEGVYRMGLSDETAKANAMLAGLGRTRRVILSDTLLDDFTPDEIEVVLAHEIGHHVFRHIRKFILFGVAQSLCMFYVCDCVLRLNGFDPGGAEILPIRALPLLALTMTIVGLIVGPIQNAISRSFEVQCDTYALRQTQNAAAFRGAFQRLARLNKADPDPHPLEVFFFHDHPPISQRLALADILDE
ncbi:MAG: STE24 endopeptidase [Pirellulaceae bacterium]|jgi:STE24 endopeptidase